MGDFNWHIGRLARRMAWVGYGNRGLDLVKRYVVKEWSDINERTFNINYLDDLDEAIVYAQRCNYKYRDGTAEHKVVDLRTDAIKYRIGWIDKTIFKRKNQDDTFWCY